MFKIRTLKCTTHYTKIAVFFNKGQCKWLLRCTYYKSIHLSPLSRFADSIKVLWHVLKRCIPNLEHLARLEAFWFKCYEFLKKDVLFWTSSRFCTDIHEIKKRSFFYMKIQKDPLMLPSISYIILFKAGYVH